MLSHFMLKTHFWKKKKKLNFTLDQALKSQRLRSSTISLTSALDGVGGQRHSPAALPRERDLVPFV
jgi:hypothetical protein